MEDPVVNLTNRVSKAVFVGAKSLVSQKGIAIRNEKVFFFSFFFGFFLFVFFLNFFYFCFSLIYLMLCSFLFLFLFVG